MTHEVHIPVPGLTHPIKPAGVVIIDGETGEALPASALFGVTLAQLLASVLPVSPNVTRGGGALDANTQRVTLATAGPGVASLSSIDNKTPALVSGAVPTTDSLGGTRAFNWEGNVREAYGTTSTAAIALPTLGASREMRVHTSSNAFIRFGGAGVAVATVGQGQMKSPSELPDVIRVPVGQTHCRVIGETASGSISLTAVI